MNIDYTGPLLPTCGRTMGARETEMTITSLHRNTLSILTVHGNVDLRTSPQLAEAVANFTAATQRRLLIDLTPTRFLSTAAMVILIRTHHQLPTGNFAVVAQGPSTARPIHLIGLHHTLDIHPTLTAALTAIAESAPQLPTKSDGTVSAGELDPADDDHRVHRHHAR